jgi:membrane-associated phospholipid phosphatase
MSVAFFGIIIYWVLHAGLPDSITIVIATMLTGLIVLIGFSRVYLRVHYASDVIAGFIIGLIWLLIALGVVAKSGSQRTASKNKRTHVSKSYTKNLRKSYYIIVNEHPTFGHLL